MSTVCPVISRHLSKPFSIWIVLGLGVVGGAAVQTLVINKSANARLTFSIAIGVASLNVIYFKYRLGFQGL
jgi:uncharacterized protein YfiM (DUF2279 family)